MAEAQNHEDEVVRVDFEFRRELARTISGARTANPIEAIYWCGQELKGLAGELDVPLSRLDVVLSGSDRPLSAECAVAYGAALRDAAGRGVEVMAVGARVTPTAIRFERPLPVEL